MKTFKMNDLLELRYKAFLQGCKIMWKYYHKDRPAFLYLEKIFWTNLVPEYEELVELYKRDEYNKADIDSFIACMTVLQNIPADAK